MCYFLGDLSSLGVVFWRILGYWRKWSRSNLDWAARIGICGIYGYIIYINDICQTWLLVDDKNLSHTTVVERRALSITDDLPEMEHCVCRMISNLERKLDEPSFRNGWGWDPLVGPVVACAGMSDSWASQIHSHVQTRPIPPRHVPNILGYTLNKPTNPNVHNPQNHIWGCVKTCAYIFGDIYIYNIT